MCAIVVFAAGGRLFGRRRAIVGCTRPAVAATGETKGWTLAESNLFVGVCRRVVAGVRDGSRRRFLFSARHR